MGTTVSDLTTRKGVLEWAYGAKKAGYDWSNDPQTDVPPQVAVATEIAVAMKLKAAWPSLFPAIEHGEPDHRAWLKAKLDAWYEEALKS